MSQPYNPLSRDADWKSSPVLVGVVAAIAVTFLFQSGSSLLLYPFRENVGDLIVRLLLVAAYLLLMVWPTVLLGRRQGTPVREALRARPASFEIGFAVVIGTLALSQVLQSYLLAQELLLVPSGFADVYRSLLRESEQFYIRLLVWNDAEGFLLSLLAGALLPAAAEELLFRGLVQGSFERSLRPAPAIVLAAFLFAAIHLRPITLVPLLFLGVFLGFSVWRSRSVYPAMLGHFIFNGLAILGLYGPGLQEAGRAARVHGVADLLATLPATSIAIVLLALAVWRINRLGRRPSGVPSVAMTPPQP